MLAIETELTDDDNIFPIDPALGGLVVIINIVVMEVIPPGVGIVPVVHRFFGVEFDVQDRLPHRWFREHGRTASPPIQ